MHKFSVTEQNKNVLA